MYRGWGQGGIKIIYGLKPMCTTRKISIKKVNYQNLMIVYYYHLPFNERFFPKFLNLLVFQLYFFNSLNKILKKFQQFKFYLRPFFKLKNLFLPGF